MRGWRWRLTTLSFVLASTGCGSSGSGGAVDGGAAAGGSGGASGGSGGTAANPGSGGIAGSPSGGSGGGSGGHTVSGSVEIVNPGSGKTTSVIFVNVGFKTEVISLTPPAGPKAVDVIDSFSIPNVPDGQYKVLVAYENDFLVEDPASSDTIVTVAGQDSTIDEPLKVTGALEIVGPDGGNQATSPLMFAWKDDSGEDHYELELRDADGNVVWKDAAVPAGVGEPTVEASYAGPPLTSNAFYQFVVTSIKLGGAPVTRTENLRGIFRAP